MSIERAIAASKIIEALDNYMLLDNAELTNRKTESEVNDWIYSEESFWRRALDTPDRYWNRSFRIPEGVLSFWVPRVPGLFHSKAAHRYRTAGLKNKAGTEEEFAQNRELRPIGKSGVVLGGIGAFLIPPDEWGNQLATICLSYNVSSGIPILIPNEYLSKLKLNEGDFLRIKKVTWVKMTTEWAKRFPSTKGLIRGYLKVDSVSDIEILSRKTPLMIHPCSIMEYESKENILYDFTFCTVDSSENNHRKNISDFFEYYRTKQQRNGKYLIAADIANPLFDSRYSSPEELRNDHAGLDLIKYRVESILINDRSIDEVQETLITVAPTVEELSAAIKLMGLPRKLLSSNSPTAIVQNIIHYCVETQKTDVLIDFISLNN